MSLFKRKTISQLSAEREQIRQAYASAGSDEKLSLRLKNQMDHLDNKINKRELKKDKGKPTAGNSGARWTDAARWEKD